MKDGKQMCKDKIIKCKRDGDRIKFKYEYINFLITPQNQLKKLELINYDYNEQSKYEQRQILYSTITTQIIEEIEQMNYQVALTGDSWEYVDKYP
ncbi:unnamed protein product [Paramecium sonneborni]|uniref:Uncharacterized protein n=1 Tax=Paramecium sonneborni TaxID=65129 RepID=A0A8S1PZC2_9CILI|nr:unnamed protein product [Paramecium sonneborni]